MSTLVSLRRKLPASLRRPLARLARRPILSSIILNWNRRVLLETTVESYLASVSVPFELTIIDNGSHDDSREFIERICSKNKSCHAVLLTENLGGEALNLAMATARGQFIHISENDIEYLPGWDKELLRKLRAFPELGQISPFSPAPRSEEGEVWVEKPSTPLSRDGVSILVADENVTTNCIIRREVWDKGVRWHNIESSVFRFPDDGWFSRDVKALGYLVAWNDVYTVVNWGCHIDEYIANLDYYVQNYADKPWLGIDGFAQRLADHGYLLTTDESGRYLIVKAPA
jgi:glycosyltransferase involved in cell wall biosynthesis